MDLDPLQNATADAVADSGVVLRSGAILILLLLVVVALAALRRRQARPDPSAMTALEHVEELRRRILVVVAAWLAGAVLAFSFRFDTYQGWPILVPAMVDNLAAQAFRVVTGHLVPDGVRLIVTRPMDGFMAELYLALGIGFLVALPLLLVQAGRFAGPALAERERRAVKRALVPALMLFALGAAFAWLLVLPLLLETLYGYTIALGAEPFLAVQELVGFTVTMTLVFGLSFQTPLVMVVLARAGLATSAGFMRKWRHAVVGIVIFSAFVTDPTLISQALVAAPLIVLYFVGVLGARWGERKAEAA